MATLGVGYADGFRVPGLSKSIKSPLEEQDAQADDHQRDAGGSSYSQDLVHPYLCLEAPTPERPRTSKNTSKTFNGVLHQVPPPRRKRDLPSRYPLPTGGDSQGLN